MVLILSLQVLHQLAAALEREVALLLGMDQMVVAVGLRLLPERRGQETRPQHLHHKVTMVDQIQIKQGVHLLAVAARVPLVEVLRQIQQTVLLVAMVQHLLFLVHL
jgi:hypothetical protein